MPIIYKDEPQKTWQEYYAEKRKQRLKEGISLWQSLISAGVTQEAILALDFLHFSSSEDGAIRLAEQLSENYEISLSERDGYWYIEGTTRPYGIKLTEQEHMDWVKFMSDVAQSHGCVFSTWSIEAPELDKTFDSADQHEI